MQGYRRQELKCHFAAHRGAAFPPIGASIFELRPIRQSVYKKYILCYILLAQESPNGHGGYRMVEQTIKARLSIEDFD